MSDTNDALERLKKKTRPTVESRDVSLTATSPDTLTSGYLDTEVSDIVDTEDKSNQETEMSGSIEASQATSLINTKEIASKPTQELETKQSTLRLEAGVSDRLQTLCRENGICREVLVEALFEYAETNPKALNKVLTQAKEKNEHRQQIANRRRAKSMMEKFGG
jgi:hypothetical protein